MATIHRAPARTAAATLCLASFVAFPRRLPFAAPTLQSPSASRTSASAVATYRLGGLGAGGAAVGGAAACGAEGSEVACVALAAGLAAGGISASRLGRAGQRERRRGGARRAAEKDVVETLATEVAEETEAAPQKEGRRVLTDDELFRNDGVPGSVYDPTKELGATWPLGYFDPFGLVEGSKEKFRNYRAMEIKHGRVGMMASVGAVFAHYVRFPGFEAKVTILESIYVEPSVYSWVILILVIMLLELGFWADPENEDIEPGNFGDPLGLGMYDDDMRNREINNGRAAMFAAAGILAAEFYTGKDAIEQFGFT